MSDQSSTTIEHANLKAAEEDLGRRWSRLKELNDRCAAILEAQRQHLAAHPNDYGEAHQALSAEYEATRVEFRRLHAETESVTKLANELRTRELEAVKEHSRQSVATVVAERRTKLHQELFVAV